MVTLPFCSASCVLVFSLCLTTAAQAALIGRLETAPGSGIYQAYYDDQLDITWLADPDLNGVD